MLKHFASKINGSLTIKCIIVLLMQWNKKPLFKSVDIWEWQPHGRNMIFSNSVVNWNQALQKISIDYYIRL